MNDKHQLLAISKKAFINVLLILVGLIVCAGIITLIIPAGTFDRDVSGQIIDGTYHVIDDVNYPIWRWIIAPFEVLVSSDAISVIMIGLFLLILGGTFTLMDETGGIRVMIKHLIERFKDHKYTLLRLVILVFMIFGAFFGIFEESIALMPVLILLSLSLGWDTLTGMAMSLLAAGFGFATAMTNPFSIGIASNLAGTEILSGALYRLLIFTIMYLILQWIVTRHAKKIEDHPELSPTYDIDQGKVKHFDLHQAMPFQREHLTYRTYVILFIVLFIGIISVGLLELFFDISIPAIPVMAAIFLCGGLFAGWVVSKKWSYTLKTFGRGMLGVAPAFILIILAVSVKHVIVSAQVMDTLLYHLSTMLNNQGPITAILMIYLLVLIIQFFIGSASAKAFLLMPLLIPLVDLLSMSRELAILAFIFGDGYTNVIFPTNGVLLIGLSIAGVSYTKWFKYTYKLQLITLVMTIIFLIIAVWIGY